MRGNESSTLTGVQEAQDGSGHGRPAGGLAFDALASANLGPNSTVAGATIADFLAAGSV
jgi:hypothetical protein